MRPKNVFCPAGLLLLLLLRQANARESGFRGGVAPKPNLDLCAGSSERRPPIARSRTLRLPISVWRANFWSKEIVYLRNLPAGIRTQ